MGLKSGYTSVYTTRAETDLVDSFAWYEMQRKGLGRQFVDSVKSSIAALEQNPEICAVKNKSYSEAVVPIFPYVVVYRVNKRKKIVRIFRVFHTSQNPKKKYG